jgi:adenine/guanine phosphoribosyltransferase-like PRPP-binding protein
MSSNQIDQAILRELRKYVIRQDDISGDDIWDEWKFYEDINYFSKVYKYFKNHFSEALSTSNYICSLGKSGLPLAAKLAFDTGKPLIIFSVSEFIKEERTFIMGIPNDKIDLSGANIFCADSHLRTGGTVRLADSILKSYHIDKIKYAVMFDTSEKPDVTKGIDVYSLMQWSDINKYLAISEERIAKDDFWMKDDKYWITYAESDNKWELNNGDEQYDKVTEPEIILLEDEEKYLLDDNIEYAKPLDLYYHVKLFKVFIDRTIKKLNNIINTIDTVVAMSVSAIPMAFVLANKISELNSSNNHEVKFIFLMNEPISYYKNNLSDRNSLLLCDDIMLTGGLLHAVRKLLVKDDSKIKSLVTIIDSKQFINRKYLHSFLANTNASFITGISK